MTLTTHKLATIGKKIEILLAQAQAIEDCYPNYDACPDDEKQEHERICREVAALREDIPCLAWVM